MRYFLQWAAGIAVLVLVLDELVKSVARLRLAPCTDAPWSLCDRLGLLGPLSLVRTANAGSVGGLRQGWWLWVGLAILGVLLIPLYAHWPQGGRLGALAVGLQVGGALGNLLDRLVLGGATDVLYVGWGPVWNLADVGILIGMLLATWSLAQQRAARRTATGPASAA